MLLLAVAVSFGAVISPGAVTAAIVMESPRRGWLVGPWITSGHVLIELGMVLVLSLGLSSVYAAALTQPISLAGGALLLAIGIGYLLSALLGKISLPEAGHAAPLRRRASLFSLGMAATLSNPFWYTWWLTVAAGYLAQVRPLGSAAIAAFLLGHAGADLGWNTFLSTMVSAGRRVMSDRLYRVLIAVMGGYMGYLGVVFLLSGIRGS